MNLRRVARSEARDPLQRRVKIKRALLILALILAFALALAWWKLFQHASGLPIQPGLRADSASPGSAWPWVGRAQVLARGAQAWSTTTGDGTLLHLMRFDMAANPRLRFSIWDGDVDDEDARPNLIAYWPRGVAQVTQKLNASWKGSRQVLAASNGSFFGYADKTLGARARGFHVGPVVLGGKVFFNGKNHRWTFGTKKAGSHEVFDVVHLPDRKRLEQFHFAAGAVQCLVKDGVALKLEPFPRSPGDFKPQPVPSTDSEAGHVPYFDHMRTSRISLAWSRDSKILWWLAVKEPDMEPLSDYALRWGVPLGGGWSVPDVQRFWLSLRASEGDRVWCAINSDAGDVGQTVWKSAESPWGYEMMPPRWSDKRMRIRLRSDFANAPLGGPVMAFVMSG